MRGFTFRRGEFVAELDPDERIILARIVADTSALLGVPLSATATTEDATAVEPLTRMSWSAEGVSTPDDPAVARLLPDASRDDDGVASEFRRLTEADLRAAKTDRLRMVHDALRLPVRKLRIDPDRAVDWAAALTDVRLVLAERLGIRTEEDAEAIYDGADSGDEVRDALALLYSAITWLQESLLQVMLPTLEA